MRVLIDTSYASRGPSGTATYLAGLIPALEALGEVEVIEASQPRRLAPGRTASGRNPLRSAVNLALDQAWLRKGLPDAARKAQADVIHHPLPAHTPAWPGPQVITVHDLAFERLPEHFDPWWRVPARRAHMLAARRSAAVVCVSAGTARDVRSRWGIDPERIVIAPHGAPMAPPGADGALGSDAQSARSDQAAKDLGTYFLYIGDAEPRKNLGALLAAYEIYRQTEIEAGSTPLELVLAGSSAGMSVAAGGVRQVSSPDPPTLLELLENATALVHPALHEGFGLTPLEAMSRGVPVLAGSTAGTVEVCADAALYFDPRDPETLAAKLHELADAPDLAARLATGGQARAAQFTWEQSARDHRDAYVLAVPGRRARE